MFKMGTRTFEIGINEITIKYQIIILVCKSNKKSIYENFIINQECKLLDVFMLVCSFAYR